MRGTKAKMLRRAAIGAVGNTETTYTSSLVKTIKIPTGKINPDGTLEYRTQEQRTITMNDCTRRVYQKIKSPSIRNLF